MKYQRIYFVFLLKLSHLYYATYLRMFMNSVFSVVFQNRTKVSPIFKTGNKTEKNKL